MVLLQFGKPQNIILEFYDFWTYSNMEKWYWLHRIDVMHESQSILELGLDF